MTPPACDRETPQGDVLRCVACNQLLAHRYGVVIVPIGARFWTEKNGRQRLECPACKARTTVERDAA